MNMEKQLGEKIGGRFIQKKKIGGGAFGEVYEGIAFTAYRN